MAEEFNDAGYRLYVLPLRTLRMARVGEGNSALWRHQLLKLLGGVPTDPHRHTQTFEKDTHRATVTVELDVYVTDTPPRAAL